MVLESHIENYLRQEVRRAGGTALKFVSPSRRGVPDRICMFPRGRLIFVEVKALGKKPTRQQEYVHEQLRGLGQIVEVVDSKEAVDHFIERVLGD
jgi:hypothetical protein